MNGQPVRNADQIAEAANYQQKPKQLRGCFIAPNGLRLIVERDDFVYKGALVIPDGAKLPPTTGTVVAVPESGDLDAWLGKRVLWSQLSGTPITFKNQPGYFALQIEEIIGEVLTRDKLEVEVGGGYTS